MLSKLLTTLIVTLILGVFLIQMTLYVRSILNDFRITTMVQGGLEVESLMNVAQSTGVVKDRGYLAPAGDPAARPLVGTPEEKKTGGTLLDDDDVDDDDDDEEAPHPPERSSSSILGNVSLTNIFS